MKLYVLRGGDFVETIGVFDSLEKVEEVLKELAENYDTVDHYAEPWSQDDHDALFDDLEAGEYLIDIRDLNKAEIEI